MNLKEYSFSDFTEKNYKNLLGIAQKNYNFSSFNLGDNSRHVVWRHDIDFSVQRALRLANIEHEAGISAIYYILLRSDFYNLFEKEISSSVRKIIALGHSVGLHFDVGNYPIDRSEDRLQKFLTYEADILSNELSTGIGSFAFHNTNEITRSFTRKSYAGLLNVYSTAIIEKYHYCSDSNGTWRFDRLEEVLARQDIKFLHASTHPAWWVPEPMPPRKRIQRAIYGRARKALKNYDALLAKDGRPNID